jgi:hypothetical protein
VGRPPADSHDHVRIADAAVPEMRRQWLALLGQLARDFDPGHAAHLAAFTTPAITASATAPGLVAKKVPSLADLVATLARIASRAGRLVLGAPPFPPTPSFAGSFDLVNEHAVAWAEQRAGALVADIDTQTRQTIAQLIARGQAGDLAVDDIARQIRPLIGLTAPQATAALNYRDSLVSNQLAQRFGQGAAGTMRSAYSLSPWRGGPLDRARIDTLTGQYAARQLAYRAESIARTESIAAATEGRRLGWDAEIRRGGADGYVFVQEWSVTSDDRACEECLGLDGERIESTPVSPGMRPSVDSMGTFPGGFDGPPAHTSCRCVVTTSLE